MRPEPPDNFFFFSQGVELLLWPLNASFSTSSCPHLSWLALSLLIVLTHTPQKMQIPYYRDTLDHFQGQRCAPLSPTNLQAKPWYDPKSLTMSWMLFFLCVFTIIILKGCLGLEQIWFPNPHDCSSNIAVHLYHIFHYHLEYFTTMNLVLLYVFHWQVGTHTHIQSGKKWPLSKVSAVESQAKVATCSLKVGALETGCRADEKFTGLHTMNDWRQEAAGKPNHWVSIYCLFLKYLMW